MPVLDADSLKADPQGMEFLQDVLGTRDEAAAPARRFPFEAWTPKTVPAGAGQDQRGPAPSPALPQIEPRFAEELA